MDLVVFVLFIWLGLWAVPSLGLCSDANPKMGDTSSDNQVTGDHKDGSESNIAQTRSSQPILYHFQSNAVWSRLNVLVSSFQDHFQVAATGNSPISGWILKEVKSGKTLSKGGLKLSSSFQFQIPKFFQGNYLLTIFVNVNQEEVPIGIQLSPQTGEKTKAGFIIGSFEEFQNNPDRSYNNMVKILYEQAVQNYENGNQENAIKLLNKAEDLDPDQPQVQSFIKKLKTNLSDTDAPQVVSQAYKKWKQGDSEKALAKLADYLDEHPDDEDALKLKTQIEESVNGPRKKHKSNKSEISDSTKNNTLKKTPSPIPSSLNREAEADQAYNLGLDAYRNGNLADAKNFWEQTLKIQPNHLQAQRNLERLSQDHPELQ